MKKWFYIGLAGFILFEILNVYFIMPMPGSQRMNSIDLAYFLYHRRWFFRIGFFILILLGWVGSRWKLRWLPSAFFLIAVILFYLANFKMAADHMFYQPSRVSMVPVSENKVDSQRLVIGVVVNNDARAYPVQYIGYHHQVTDSVGGLPLIITYCTVCRTGRVFQPLVKGKHEKFRLVGMDHFNAMFEDAGTHSWWRQVNGEAIAGKLKGERLPEWFSSQTTLEKWLALHPGSKIMQPDETYQASYDSLGNYESGKSRGSLTKTDSLSWKDKSWVVGLTVDGIAKAYDWNQLKKERMLYDQLGQTPVMIVLSEDGNSFFAFERPDATTKFLLTGDTIIGSNGKYQLDGKGIDQPNSLIPISSSQEFWHSWRTFQPQTEKYEDDH